MIVKGALCLLGASLCVQSTVGSCLCPCPCKPDGGKLRSLINCFASWSPDVATGPGSSLENCNETETLYCKTTSFGNHWCRFDGTNLLSDTSDAPECYYSCGMRSCNSWIVPKSDAEKQCIVDLYS